VLSEEWKKLHTGQASAARPQEHLFSFLLLSLSRIELTTSPHAITAGLLAIKYSSRVLPLWP
jgi:hypothetical protein